MPPAKLLEQYRERLRVKRYRSWPWQYVFPSGSRSTDPLDGVIRRHHLDEKVIQRAVSEAARTRTCRPR